MKKTPIIKPYPWYYRPLEWLLLGLSSLPLSVLYGISSGLYLLMAYVVRYRQRVVLENLRNSFPEKSDAEIAQLARQFYRHFSEVMVEILKLATMPAAELKQRVLFRNVEVMERHFAQGRTVLGLSSHAGNWEWVLTSGATWLSAHTDGVYKPLSNPFFESFLYHLRTRTGSGLIPMRDTLRDMVQRKGEVRVVSMLSDQAAGPEDRPYWTTFMNQESGFYTSAERLASRFHCPVVYVSIQRLRRGYYEIILTELYDGDAPLPAGSFPITDAFVQQLERDIRLFPADYLWTHRRWKHKRPALESKA
ncbi:lysophospholipid acyltransferase family protein [Hymenobacter sp. 5516J-16]|uniref:Lysophospholipid acyltransferase family protein n=1 Tax=Hymenobacter sublimis TaxID=2933777 RepID=A0ABY4JAT2_9BACT|nr:MULTISPECIES: lysophospholipid acyltransferase family protein [Hymenobacter]UOQ76260.1 lysophospholipid acyltransferase family protein [Hymenobacter sp. 5516J-16]UPL49930.1 lysophospholipid acyltransferase family protein [Hymenobacter sublimis]